MSMKSENKRLFVPLNSEAYNWFKQGKKWEVRKYQGQYTTNNVIEGKRVELRKGYNGESIWGVINEVKVLNNIQDLFQQINFNEIFPTLEKKSEAIYLAQNYIDDKKIIAFKVNLTDE